jgi:hypothetical protein
MSKQKKESFFWTSYSDLMTSLFFVMLVLFVLVIVLLHRKISEQDIKLAEFEKIEEIKRSINEIDTAYFEYRSEYKKHIFKLLVQYPKGDYNISHITDVSLLPQIERAGQEIERTIKKFTADDNIQYLVLIEGQASADGYYIDDYHNNNVLSYLRALNLETFWKSKGIYLDKLRNCELIIAGSGEKGIPREVPDWQNPKNQRFLIHIIPKTGVIEATKK